MEETPTPPHHHHHQQQQEGDGALTTTTTTMGPPVALHQDEQEIRVTINTSNTSSLAVSARRRDPQSRSVEDMRRHTEEVTQAVERLVLHHGVGGATTVPAAFAVRPRSLSSSAPASSCSGLVREKLVTLVTAALAPSPLEEEEEEGDDVRRPSPEEEDEALRAPAVAMPQGRVEERLFEDCRVPSPGEEGNGEELLGEVSITVPSTMDKDLMLSQSEHDRYVMNVVQRLVPIAGRVTAVPAMGYWMLESPTTTASASAAEPRLMQERVTIVSAVCVVDAKVRAVVRDTARWLATAMGQEAVFVKMNNQPYLIRLEEREDQEKMKQAAQDQHRKAKKLRGRRGNKLYRFFSVEPTVVYDCNYQAK